MIQDAAKRRQQEKSKQNAIEKEIVSKLQKDIEQENNMKAEKKANERSHALQVIRENEQKQKRKHEDYLH